MPTTVDRDQLNSTEKFIISQVFSARCNIYISRLCYDASVRLSVHLSVTEVHWHIIANLHFKFQSKFIARARMHVRPR